MMVERIRCAPKQYRRFATIFRRGEPTYLHLDIDDKRDGRRSEDTLVRAVLDLITKNFSRLVGEAPDESDWLWMSATTSDKTSVHLHATVIPFKEVDDLANFMEHYKNLVETSYDDRESEYHTQSRIVATKTTSGAFEHVVDASIYHHNALLKMAYQNKPGKPPMIPVIFQGERIEETKIISAIIAASAVHTPKLMEIKRKSPQLLHTIPPISKKRPNRKRVIPRPGDTHGYNFKTRAAKLWIEEIIQKTNTETTSFSVELTKEYETGELGFYVKYDGKHGGPCGKTHSNNNATVLVDAQGGMKYNCFSVSCTSRHIGKIPFSYAPSPPEEVKEDPEVLELVQEVQSHPLLNVHTVNEKAQKLLDDFRSEFDETNPEKYLVKKLVQDYIDLVDGNWVQINQVKVVYGERRIKRFLLSARPELTMTDRKVVQLEWILREKTHFMSATSHFTVTVPKITGPEHKRKCTWRKVGLNTLWLDAHDKRKIFDHIVQQPDPSLVSPKEFNMWTPLAIDEAAVGRFLSRRGWTDDDCLRRLQPWLNHMYHIIADGNRDHYEYLLNWWSFVLNKKEKTGIAILLMSDHGAGKSITIENYSEILGPRHACTLTRAEELTGKFNSHLGLKLFVCSEEATYGGTRKDQGHLKNLITMKTINVRPLYQPMYTVESRHNIVVVSNRDQHVLPMDPTERRYACFYPSDRFSGMQTPQAKTWFDKVRAVPVHLIAWFHYTQWKGDGFNPRLSIPVTDATQDQKLRSASSTTRFILEILQTSSQHDWVDIYSDSNMQTLFSHYREWCKQNRINHYGQATLHAFSKFAKRHLITRRTKEKIRGKWKNVAYAWNRNLELQRLKFAQSMQLPSFPLLNTPEPWKSPVRVVEEDEDDEEKEELNTYTDVMNAGLSDTEIEAELRQVSKKQRRRYTDCPAFCIDRHPHFVKKAPDGTYQVCEEDDPGAHAWHSIIGAKVTVPEVPMRWLSHDADVC